MTFAAHLSAQTPLPLPSPVQARVMVGLLELGSFGVNIPLGGNFEAGVKINSMFTTAPGFPWPRVLNGLGVRAAWNFEPAASLRHAPLLRAVDHVALEGTAQLWDAERPGRTPDAWAIELKTGHSGRDKGLQLVWDLSVAYSRYEDRWMIAPSGRIGVAFGF